MTPALRQFLTDWLAWAEAGAPEHPVFRRKSGLCMLAQIFWEEQPNSELVDDLQDALEASFGETHYPFGGAHEFHIRMLDHTQHENPARLAWVRQQLGVEEGKDLHESLMQAHRDSVTVKGPIRAKEGGE